MLALKDLNNPYALDKIVVELSRKKETVLCHTMYLATIRKKQLDVYKRQVRGRCAGDRIQKAY